jgi:mannose-1-phosphate guanylyltransferase/mannose-6-phosphate isomerase
MFAEKPDAARAESYITQGYLWNSGNFLFQARVMKGEFETFMPAIWSAATEAVAGAIRDLDFLRLAEKPFSASPKISIDYAIMEKTKRSAVVPVDMGWSDLGSWEAIWENAARDENGNALAGPCYVLDVKNTIVHSDQSILTTVIGLNDVMVVSSADAVLVAPRRASGEIKTLVESLKSAGRTEATEHRHVHRPWGHYVTVSVGELHRVNRILINPGQRFSLQKHCHRSEHWIVIKGTGEITINRETRILHENESTYISIGTEHRIANPGLIPLEIIEVQIGNHLGADDIIRIEDAYDRSGSV